MKQTLVLSLLVISSLILVASGVARAITAEGTDPSEARNRPAAARIGSPSTAVEQVFIPLIISQAQQEQPSKTAYIIHDRIRRVDAALAAAHPQRSLPPQIVSELSDNLLRVNSAGEILVEFHSKQAVGPTENGNLEARGATIVNSTADLVWPQGMQMPPGLGTIVAWMPHNQIVTTAEQLSWVAAVRPVESNPPDAGTFLSEGVALHNADDAQALGIDGTGVTVGAISDGVNNLAASQALGDLPAVVTFPAGCGSAGGDEGTAMLEIIYDMAPGAALQFCATGGGVANHVAAQNNLVAGGVDLIAEDIAFDGEPAFQRGRAAFNGDQIAAAGVTMHSSAGNRGQQHAARVQAVGTGGGPDGVAGPFAGCPFTPDNVVAIAPGGDTTFDLIVPPPTPPATSVNLQVTLQWSEPRAIFPTVGAGGFTDLNLYVMDAGLTTCLGSSANAQGNGNGDTIEQVVVPFAVAANTRVKLVVDVQGAAGAVATPVIDLRWRPGIIASVDIPTRAGSLNPDSNYTGLATSSAAANAGASTNPNTVGLEAFSSGGPVQLQLTTVCPGGYPCPGGSVAGPAATFANAPNWTAADGVSVSGVGNFGSGTCPAVNQGDCRFFGTSAAAPHAAACDALVRQNIGGTPTAAVINARLASAVTDRGPAGFDNVWGAGVLDCLGAAFHADLSLTKTDSPDPVVAGTNLSYVLEVTNNGPDDAPGLVVTDDLPSGVSFSSSPDGCTETAPNSGIVTCALASLANLASASFTINVAVDPDLVYNAGGPTTITNQAEVENLVATDPDLSNNAVSEDTLVVAEADLEIVKSDAPDPAVAGEQLVYTLQVTNHGPSSPTDAQVVDTLPSGVTHVSDNAGCLEAPPGTLTCDLTGVPVGAPREVAIIGLIDADLVYNAGGPTTITNQASVEPVGASDPDSTDNTAAEDTLVVAVADLEIVSFEAVDPPAEVLVGEPVDILLRKVITNNGPSAPMDVELTGTATAPADSTVTPTMRVTEEPALELDELRVVEERYTIQCGAASHHLFTFTNEIQPLNPEDTDPDLSNNMATVELDIECVVPVVINIKPGSFPNSINPRNRGVIPIAILTTLAGEYGTPLDFDGTTIDPLSVRFGLRDDVWFGTGGASEAHGRGHVEDSWELDESTRDGDEDLVLHFRTQETGIQAGETKACVKGEWLDSDEQVHQFFGCDSIRTVGKSNRAR